MDAYALLRGDWTEIAERARRQQESAERDGPLIISNGSGLCDGTDPSIVLLFMSLPPFVHTVYFDGLICFC